MLGTWEGRKTLEKVWASGQVCKCGRPWGVWAVGLNGTEGKKRAKLRPCSLTVCCGSLVLLGGEPPTVFPHGFCTDGGNGWGGRAGATSQLDERLADR